MEEKAASVEEIPPAEAPAPPDASAPPSLLLRAGGVLKEIAIILLLFLALRNFVVQARFIPSASMHPTLLENDRLLVEIFSKHLLNFHRGEILVFYVPQDRQPDFVETIQSSFGLYDDGALIKRVVGLPGDVIEVLPNEGVFVNGEHLDEDYVAALPNEHYGPITVPEGHLFMMGDNRNQSRDSRRWGTLPASHVIGRALVRFYPLRRIGLLWP